MEDRTPPLTKAAVDALPEWVDEDSREALLNPAVLFTYAVIAAARVIRAADAATETQDALRSWLKASVQGHSAVVLADRALYDLGEATAALREYTDSSENAAGAVAVEFGLPLGAFIPSSVEPNRAQALRAMTLRDDAESIAWALGLARDGVLEQEVLDACGGLDEVGDALAPYLEHDARGYVAHLKGGWLEEMGYLTHTWWTAPLSH